jgi:hypothetical protein
VTAQTASRLDRQGQSIAGETTSREFVISGNCMGVLSTQIVEFDNFVHPNKKYWPVRQLFSGKRLEPREIC